MKTYLFFDTETTGINPKKARLVQLSAYLVAEDGKKLLGFNAIVCPDGFEIPNDATKIHGISTEKARLSGYQLHFVMNEFYKMLTEADVLVCHNVDYDLTIMGKEFRRLYDNPSQIHNQLENRDAMFALRDKEKVCTMKTTAAIVKVRWLEWGGGSWKFPKLQELHQWLFNESFAEAHNAKADIQATIKCFFQLLKMPEFVNAVNSESKKLLELKAD